jgi:hypothetical protein
MAVVTVEQIADELRDLPPPLLAKVHEFVCSLSRNNSLTSHDPPDIELAEEGMGEFLTTLQDYEERLARGEIHWK